MICVSMQPSLCTTQSYSSSTSRPTLRSTTRFSLCSSSERGRKPDSQHTQHSNTHIRTHIQAQSHDCGLTVNKAGTLVDSRQTQYSSTYNCSVGVEIDTCSGDGQSRAAGDAAVPGESDLQRAVAAVKRLLGED